MFIVIWEYKVRTDCTHSFEQLYGRNGEWENLFMRHAGYLGTELCKRKHEANTYITLDRWESEELYQKFLFAAKEEYETIDKMGEDLMEDEIKIGSFEEC